MQKLRNIALIALLLAAGVAHAQAVSDPLQYTVSPETPGPNQLVLIEVQGVGTFLGNAAITWSQDGTVVQSGVGERIYRFTTKGLGQTTRIRIAIRSDTNGSYNKDFTFTPSLVNLIWEADTTVPPFYLGKALYSAGSALKIAAFPVAFAGGSQIAPSALSYQWSRNDEPVPGASGLGRTTFSVMGDQLQLQESVSVDVLYGSTKVARGELVIPATEPVVLFYQRDALSGTRYNTALPGAIQLNASEITLQAEPYYFSGASKRAGQLSYTWTLNGDPASGPDSGRGLLTLRQAGAGQGSATVEASIENKDNNAFIQTARAALQIVFGRQNSSLLNSFFGI